MYTLADALRLREHILGRWEAADRDPALVEDGAVTVVVVGGGPTGIESAGALAELYRSNFAEDFPGIPQAKARIVLVEAGPTLLSMFHEDIREYTQKTLEERGVEILLGETVASIDADAGHAQVGDGHRRAHAGLGGRAQGQPDRRLAGRRAAARRPRAGRARPEHPGPPGGLRRG